MGRRDTKHFPRQTAQIVFRLADWVLRTGPALLWIGRAFQAGTSEHGTGRALDIIASSEVGIKPTAEQKAAGDRLVAWLIKHADQLHIRHIIWQNKIWKRRYRGQGWQPLPGNRREVSDAHYDHVHVLFDDADGSIPDDPITSTPTTAPTDWSILMANDLPQNVRADMQVINESAIQRQLVQEGRAPTLSEIADAVTERLLGSWLGTSGPSVAVALQDGFHTERANSKRLDGIEKRLAALEGRE